jgi:hypothetical protein
MQLLSAGEVCRILGTASGQPFSMKTLDNWCAQSVITPVVDRKGHGNHRVFSIVDVLAIAVGRGMRAGGYMLETAAGVMRVIKGFSEERLLVEFERGHTCITFLGDHVYPRLLPEQDARKWGGEFESTHPEMFSSTGLCPQAIDVQRVYQNILRVIDGDGRARKRKRMPAR